MYLFRRYFKFDLDEKLENWLAIKSEHHLLKSKSFQWIQLIDALTLEES